MTYFSGLEEKDELKKRFKQLSKQLHPDLGGNEEQFKAMLNEYQSILENASNQFCGTDVEELSQELKDLLKKVLRLQDVEIDLVGSWLWVEGNTFPHKEFLKTSGFKWSKNRKKWYFHEGDFKKGKSKKSTFQEIQKKYGSKNFKSDNKGSYLG